MVKRQVASPICTGAQRDEGLEVGVDFLLPLAAAIGLEAGERVPWELLDRHELHLVRPKVPSPQARRRGTTTAPKTECPQHRQ